MIDDELDIFFDSDDFAVSCTRQRAATADLVFAGIKGHADEAAFDAHAIMPAHRLRFASSHDVRRDDVLLIGAATYKVERVDPVVNGAEAEALLVQAA